MTPVRILQVVTNMDRGGLETMLMNYYRHMDRQRVQFDFLVHRTPRGAYDDEIEAMGGKIYRLPRLVPWSASYRRALGRFFDEHPEYTVVHVHQDCLSAVILKAAKKHGVKTGIAHSHNANQDRNLKYPIKLFYRRFIPKYASHLFACGESAGRWMFGGAPFDIVANAIDAEEYAFDDAKRAAARKALGIGDDEFVVGHVGRFMPQKNHGFIVEVFTELLKMCRRARLLLVGDGELRGSIEDKLRTAGIADRVIFTGVRPDIPELLSAMDAFILPSLYEGLCIAAVEAQAAGLGCVISDRVPGECEVTRGLVTAMSLDASAESWAEQLLKKREIPRINRASELESAGYDIRANAEKLMNFYLGECGK